MNSVQMNRVEMSRVPPLDPAVLDQLASARLDDPFAVLGPHEGPQGRYVRVFVPGAEAVAVQPKAGPQALFLEPGPIDGLFCGPLPEGAYGLSIRWPKRTEETEDPYAFGPLLRDLDLHLFSEGRHFRLTDALGAAPVTVEGVPGTRFAVWAPNARRVSVVGDFNGWDGRRHAMRRRGASGVFEIFIPRVGPGALYKYEIVGPDGALLPLKADPVARATQLPPETASVVPSPRTHRWRDEAFMASRAARNAPSAPISIYEVHAGSWLRDPPTGAPLSWLGLAERLVPYVKDLGFTHVELLPVTEHPFTGSWGYQPLGLFAPSRRFGEPEDFAAFVDACHRADIGVIVDFVPAHFPSDAHGLARFDGTALYEHADPREGFHQDWNTLIYNLGRREVAGFLIASALHWLEHFHVDGLRVDAVASMLYRDYSRKPGEWIPNRFGGRENLESVDFLRHLNAVVAERCPGAITLAEESTAWPGVSSPSADGGLGFSYKWNMGWMHDTLHYIAREPVYRRHHHDELTFSLVYAFSERFVLPLSHDEVVHGKGSLIGKMPGDTWQKRANLRALLGLMWTHPGKKLLFMGGEIGQEREWSHDREIDWFLLDDPAHRGIQSFVRDLNRLYRELPALHTLDDRPEGFRWIVGDDRENSVLAFLRLAPDAAPVLAVINLTPVPRQGYRIGVPAAGRWREVLNSDAPLYGGSGMGNYGGVETRDAPAHGEGQSLDLTLPPLSTLLFVHAGDN
ncbi:1,4-alpha-glucan branching enzyme [Xanthobacter flavus]|uniref:1,4-alpha-glucan branching enzyme GlgB n=2 Tax=Xanthobacter flavus TaxID=281 RepID=A0A9W6FNB7_XANFL|nr:1,4-alpha-glucan branching protein GlgB [Xanthobacter flavus]MDR6335813.1 1,4-alpha-glucan branching enzyme [Xanthobacter flavus]GLI24302.1 1,4-alpha-glucan branching enzyme GlgB 1 [Xanthobacter flavus]